MFFEVAQQQAVKMERGAGAFVYGVGAVGVFHEVYGFVEFDQAIEEEFAAGVVDVVVAAEPWTSSRWPFRPSAKFIAELSR